MFSCIRPLYLIFFIEHKSKNKKVPTQKQKRGYVNPHTKLGVVLLHRQTKNHVHFYFKTLFFIKFYKNFAVTPNLVWGGKPALCETVYLLHDFKYVSIF